MATGSRGGSRSISDRFGWPTARHKSETNTSRSRRPRFLVEKRRWAVVPAQGDLTAMHFKSIALASAAAALILPATVQARSMRAVGSSTVYPFAKMAAERVARANPRLGTPIIESTGTGAGFKLF